MKLTKINLSELSNADLNELEMCRLLGGGDPGCCQCSCAGTSTTGTNNSYNNKDGLVSDPEAEPCCSTNPPPPTEPSICFCPEPLKLDTPCDPANLIGCPKFLSC